MNRVIIIDFPPVLNDQQGNSVDLSSLFVIVSIKNILSRHCCKSFDFFKHQQQQKNPLIWWITSNRFKFTEKKVFVECTVPFIDASVQWSSLNERCMIMRKHEDITLHLSTFYLSLKKFKLEALLKWIKTLTKSTPRKRAFKCVYDEYITRSMCVSNECVQVITVGEYLAIWFHHFFRSSIVSVYGEIHPRLSGFCLSTIRAKRAFETHKKHVRRLQCNLFHINTITTRLLFSPSSYLIPFICSVFSSLSCAKATFCCLFLSYSVAT